MLHMFDKKGLLLYYRGEGKLSAFFCYVCKTSCLNISKSKGLGMHSELWELSVPSASFTIVC